jgi:hypothetical protein
MKTEVWLFEETGVKTPTGKPTYRRLAFNFVSYDGSSTEQVEPVSDNFMTGSRDSYSDKAAGAATSWQIIRKGLAEEFFAVNDFGTI